MIAHMDTPTPTETPPTEATIAEAAEKFGIVRRSLQRAVERGKIPARKIGNLYVVDLEAVRLFAEIAKAKRALADYTGQAADDDE
ncbi:recombination directionality factor [Mycobacterium phage Mercurio]|uniref:MerR-like helix-turn-helix DNA binding domain protein n=1 Tax=Mycobacterium phage Mercurio TaxID=2575612 RepID=A0A5J6T6L6_9CAUD|nr:recombination directionality factor [Mycobacterium phage Mercurio]QFG06036.1 MerR-like helix-turn-helix DNA binding domain protein [Mycobacterium phage Mercurio]